MVKERDISIYLLSLCAVKVRSNRKVHLNGHCVYAMCVLLYLDLNVKNRFSGINVCKCKDTRGSISCPSVGIGFCIELCMETIRTQKEFKALP